MQEIEFKSDTPLSFQIEDITLLEVKLGPISELIPDDVSFTCKFQLNHQIALTTGVIRIVVQVDIERADTNEHLSNVSVGYKYQVSDIEKHPLEDGKLPRSKIMPLNATSISTTRGIFYSLVRGTFLQKAIIPVVPIDTFQPVL